MSESTGDGEASSSGDKLAPASNTVGSLLQNIMDLDVAATLGLYDDPATSLGMTLDTSALQDVVLDMSGSHLLPAAPPLSQATTMAVTPPPPDVPPPQTSLVSPSSFLTSTALSSASQTAPVKTLEFPSSSAISAGEGSNAISNTMVGVTSDGKEQSSGPYGSEESGRVQSESMNCDAPSASQSQGASGGQGPSQVISGIGSPADQVQSSCDGVQEVAGAPLPSSVLAALGITVPQKEGVVNSEEATPDIVVELAPRVAAGSELLMATGAAAGSAPSLPVAPPIASSISGILPSLTAESTCSSTLPVTTPTTSASLSDSSQGGSVESSTAASSMPSSTSHTLLPSSTSAQLSTPTQPSNPTSPQTKPSTTTITTSQPPKPASSQPSPSTTSTPSHPPQSATSQPTASQPSPSTTTSTPTSTSDSTPKGLNLPLLQFLQVNFPNLQLDNFQDIYQVNALLAHALQQQQQMQQQIKQTAQQLQESRQQLKQKQGAAIGSGASLSKLTSSSSKLGSPVVGTSTGGAGRGVQVGGTSGGSSVASSSPAIKSPAVRLGGGSLTASPASRLTGSAIAAGGRKTITLPGAGSPINLGGGTVGSKGTVINTLATKLGSKATAGTITTTFKKAQSPVAKAHSPQPPSPGSPGTTTVGKGLTITEADLTGANRTPVFARILANMKQQQKLISSVASISAASKGSSPAAGPSLTVGSSPLVLGGGGGKQSLIQATVPQFPSPLHHTASSKMSARTAAKSASNRTLIEHEEAESMDVDVVGEGMCAMLELPPHLRDHTYSHYNPEEGGKNVALGRPRAIRVTSSIPPSRVSYAPKVPDSPDTLYKLLKVVTRKSYRRNAGGSQGSSRTSGVPKAKKTTSKKGRFTPSGGGKSRRTARNRAAGSRGSSSTPGSRAMSEEMEPEFSANSTDQSDDEDFDPNSTSNSRRRSQRVAGQRKRYVDDLSFTFSDEELQENIMNPRPLSKKEYRGYGEEEDWDFADQHLGSGTGGGGGDGGLGGAGSQLRSSKHKTKTVSVNPTEGFQYSDIYFEPPAEEANVVDKILQMRVRPTKTDDERKKYGENVEEFLVKYKNYSYLHTTWAPMDKILVGDKRFEGKVKRYKAKQAAQGAFANIDDEPFNPEYTVVDRILDVATQNEGNEVVTHYLVKWRSLPYEDATWELEEDVDAESIRKFNLLQILPPEDQLEFQPRPPPHAFKQLKLPKHYKEGNELRPYQLEGVNWLLFNWYARQNCILADEMGLGKTVQSIALLLEIQRAGIRGPFLVIAPLSTIANWEREFGAWSDFNVVVYHGSAYSRRLIHEYELYYRNEGRVISDAFKFNCIVTTYEVMLSDDSELQSIQWRVVIIDEAHRLKNRHCKLLEELKSLDMEHRVLLTGTPLQNSVEELFSLLNFLEPSTFPSHVSFLQQFGNLKTEEQVEELKGILKPMMLRRLKEDVEKSLAPKEETIVEVELTVIQKQYYRAILERNFTFLSKGSSSSSGPAVPSLINVMMELRKCCNHPYLIQGAEQAIVTDFQARHTDQPLSNALIQASGKMVLIDKLLAKLKESGHKVLIFSQMVRCLDILEDFLRLRGYFYERIDGNVRGCLRQEAIDRFSKPNSDRFVFLLCTRAGGLGINLTAADTVIIYDSDWNPQNDLQAQARCHRIGQNKSVKIYRLITHNTYEREMFDRASLKLGLDKAVLQSMQQSSSSNGSLQLSKKEVEDLLKRGAYGAIMDEDDDANKFCEEDIDQILERRAHVIQLESEGKGSTFSKASFAADGSSDINVDDPEFWQKWAAKANLDLDELANKDSLVLDTPRLRRQVRRYGNDSIEEIVEMNEAIDEALDLLPSCGKQGWTKLECLKVEKGLLVYGWREWRSILRHGKFKKRKLGIRDIENIARHILMYCLSNFSGDEKVPPYIMRLLDPSVVTETPSASKGEDFYYDFSPEDFQILQEKEPDLLFQDSSYRKHLKRHTNKILLRVRQLHVMRWSMFVNHMDKIMSGVPAKSLGLDLPRPEEPPPAPWWNKECDHSLMVGIIKHGYEQFGLMRSDPALCFRAMCGEEPAGSQKKKRRLAKKALAAAKKAMVVGGKDESAHVKVEEEDSEGSETGEGEESDGEGEEYSAPSTPASLTKRQTRSNNNTSHLKIRGFYVWPSLAEVNTRARRFVSAWLKHRKREESKIVHLQREREKLEKQEEASRRKELKKAELAQKWSKREEQDFARVISSYGVEFNRGTNKYEWGHFRQLASLNKKSDERLTLYLHDFKQMCWRVLKKKKIKHGVSGMRVEPVTEEKAARCLQRISLLSTIREEILPHPEFEELIKLCEVSFEVAHWWIPGLHDTDLMKGVAKHGLTRSDQLIYPDPDLRFKETVPQTALFDPNANQESVGKQLFSEGQTESGESGEEEGGEEEKGEAKPAVDVKPSAAVPLGWPKEKAIVMRMTRIVYAFRHRVWPKPMEGLDLFLPQVKPDENSSSSDESGVEGEVGMSPYSSGEDIDLDASDSDCQFLVSSKRSKRPRRAKAHARTYTDDLVLDGEGEELGEGLPVVRRDFEIEKSQGLKLTLKKAGSSGVPGTSLAGSGDGGSSGGLGVWSGAGKNREKTHDTAPMEPLKLEVRIPLVQLSFPSSAGMKRIPKKRPLPPDSGSSLSPGGGAGPPEQKRRKQDSKNATFKIVHPTEVSVKELTGLERVGVINRNTNEKLPPKQSPMLKNLRLWLEGHPHFNVEADWGPLVIEWGSLKSDMYHRILQHSPPLTTATSTPHITTPTTNLPTTSGPVTTNLSSGSGPASTSLLTPSGPASTNLPTVSGPASTNLPTVSGLSSTNLSTAQVAPTTNSQALSDSKDV